MKKKVVVIYSGGMDSSVLLAWLLKHDYDVYPLLFDYGQRHEIELEYARKFCVSLGLQIYRTVDMKSVGVLLKSSQTDIAIPVPHGHYKEESMKLTVVPNRNMIMLSVATGYAVSVGVGIVAFGAHGGDHAIYPDCRPEFVDALSEATEISNWDPVSIIAPFLCEDKTSICKLGHKLRVDFSLTWTCYDPMYDNGKYLHCGLCGSCCERREAFKLSGVSDPTIYKE